MRTLSVAVDPGIRGSGISCMRGAELVHAAYVRNPSPRKNTILEQLDMAKELFSELNYLFPEAPVTLVVERPQIYTQDKLTGDPNDLVPLMGITAAFAGLLSQARQLDAFSEGRLKEYLPRAWKGTIDPMESTRRVRERLTDSEFKTVKLPGNSCESCLQRLPKAACTKTSCLAHNVYDAIGINLKANGRFEPRKVFAR